MEPHTGKAPPPRARVKHATPGGGPGKPHPHPPAGAAPPRPHPPTAMTPPPRVWPRPDSLTGVGADAGFARPG